VTPVDICWLDGKLRGVCVVWWRIVNDGVVVGVAWRILRRMLAASVASPGGQRGVAYRMRDGGGARGKRHYFVAIQS